MTGCGARSFHLPDGDQFWPLFREMAVLRTWRSTCLAYLESATSRLASPIIISPVHSAGTWMLLFCISRCVPGHVLSPISCLKKAQANCSCACRPLECGCGQR